MKAAGKRSGDKLEKEIESTNKYYRDNKIALINKVATPTTVIRRGKKIVSAFFSEQSTLDYVGVYKGIAISFDAKRTQENRFPLNNIREHQLEFMKEWNEQGGYTFLLIHMVKANKYILLEYEELLTFVELRKANQDENGNTKRGFASITLEDLLKHGEEITINGNLIDYMEIVKRKFRKA